MKNTTTILQYFREQVAATPHAPAVQFESQLLSYGDLDRESDRLAFEIKRRGLLPASYLYVYMERSSDFIIAMMAIFKAGMIYVPLDVEWPVERLKEILKNTNEAGVITNCDQLENVFSAEIPVIRMPSSAHHPVITTDDCPLAYVIYTSGSTGRPKGTVITHEALLASSLARMTYYGPVNQILLIPSFAFDASLAAICWSLLSGGCLQIVGDAVLKSAVEIKKVFHQNTINAVVCVPSYYRFLLEEDVFNIRKPEIVILGGESWGKDLADEHYAYSPHSQLYNEYGPTECTVWATVAKVLPGKGVNIGHPVPGVVLAVLDPDGKPVAEGASGEIYLSGRQLALGYLHLEGATEEAFVHLEGARFYKTGDIARYDADQSLIYLGRKDDQVKIDGHRIELGEIAQAMASHPEIKQAHVLNISGTHSYLAGFYLSAGSGSPDQAQLRSFLQKRLPAYMIPAELFSLSHFPLTSNGKVDKEQLLKELKTRSEAHPVLPPETVFESNILSCWQYLFQEDKISTTQEFASLGGSSLQAMRMISYLSRNFNYRLSIGEVFSCGTIQALAALLELRPAETEMTLTAQEPKLTTAPLSSQQQQMWIIDQLEGSRQYHIEIIYQLPAHLDVNVLTRSLNLLAERHPVLRTVLTSRAEEISQTYVDSTLLLQEISDAQALVRFLEKPFDLSADLMFRAAIYKEDVHHQLYLVFHHIAADGWSLSILINDLAAIYEATLQGRTADLEKLPVSYLDYAQWQQQTGSTETTTAAIHYWKNKLENVMPAGFPADRRYPALPSRKGQSSSFFIPAELKEEILGICKKEKVTLYTFLLTMLNLLISKYNNGLEDLCVGSVLANRADSKSAELVGYLANTVALRVLISQNMTVAEALKQVKDTVLEAHTYGQLPFERVVEELKIPRSTALNPLFGVMLVLQDTTLPADIFFDSGTWHLQDAARTTSKFDLLWDITESEAGLRVLLEYNTDIYDQESIESIGLQFDHLIKSVVQKNTSVRVSDLEWFIDTPLEIADVDAVSFPADLTLVDVFHSISNKFPDHIAVVYEGRTLTYAALDLLSNQLGHYLRDQGVSAGVLVPICADRSLEMLAGMLGILKAGGAYVPIDPVYPQDRISFMLEDTGASFVLLTKAVKLDSPLRKIMLEGEEWRRYPETELKSVCSPEDLAYVIYTSGSTGRPKGVMIEHRNVIRLFFNDAPLFDFSSQDTWCLFHSFCFDFSVWEIYGALLFGGKLIVVPKDALNAIDFAGLLEREGVTVLNQTPTAFYALQDCVAQNSVALKVRYVIFGGEALSPFKVATWKLLYPLCKLVNMYGITETTVHVTYKEITEKEIKAGISNIGKPIPTLGCLILDQDLRRVPTGVSGELFVSGYGLARGYLHNAALTESRFILNPFGAGRLYRTGDLVRWQSDGTLEYLGRMDDQVKIRGYRIELGEIETVLQRSGLVKQCVVIARDGKLIGYVVSDSFDKAALLAYLHTQLPDYMVPSILVSLDQIPMTTNGKVNRKALPQALTLLESDDEQPGTATEELLCGIWQELLGLEKIGINDNFFEIGGDSIVSIQVVSRARKQGLQLQPRDIFRCQTIRALAGLLSGTTDIQGEQGELSGTAGLLPIQRWFFSQGHQSVSHYNQSLLLGVRKLIEKEQLQDIINVLLGQHDALHFRYEQKEGQWEQRYEQATIELEEAFLNNEDLPSVCSKYQAQLSITSGPLFRAVLLRNPASSEENLLLLVAHHLCVDGVSWRIIAADLQHCLENLAQNKALSLGVKGSSYRQWQERLQRYANSSFLHKQISYWSSVLSSAERLPADYELEGPRYISSMNRKESLISASLTDLLLHEVHAAYHTEVKDLLLAALALTLGDWTGSVRHLIGLEGHGREDLGSDIDLSHTVGWFTTLYPVLLEMESSGAGDYGQLICGIKERLREVPDHGLGYGALRYLHEDEAVRQQMSGTSEPDLVFNYLGHLGNLVNNSAWLSQPADMILSAGDLSAADNSYPFRLGIDSYIYEDQFRLIWSYNREEYASATIEALASAYLQHLENLISHCMARRNQSRYTPSDYGLSGKMSLKVLASHNESSGPAAQGELYGMSSLQEGMLFHGLYDNNSGTYIEQFSCELENVNPKLLKSAWAQVIAGYSILRSSFCDEGFNALIQRAHRNVELPFGEQDFRELSGTALEAAIDAFLKADRLQGFNFHIAPLMRVQLLHLSEQRSRMVWTFHHILLDGWSVPLVISRLQSAYGQLLSGKVQALLPVDNYGDFIQYLELRNRFAEQEYWQGYLSGFDTPSLLPFVGNGARRNQGTGAIGTEVLTLDATFTEQIQQYGQQQHVTVNTIMQGVWSYLLSRYTGQEDVLFGVTVSGRPTDLEHADHRVGLYIHTIPQRSILAESGTFAAWLLALQQGHTSSREYPYIPLTVVQDLLGIKGDLFDSLLVFENYPVYASATAEGLSLSAIQLAEHTNYLLSIIVEPGSSLRLSFSYNSELLAAEKVAMIAAHFKYVLEQTVADPGLLLHAIALADAAELARIQSFQGNTVPFPQQTLSSLFAASAALHADHTAVVYEGAALSYAELDALSNRLGHYLQAQGVSAGVLVPICADRSLEMIIAILGILKAGGAYVPIDPLYPQDRILFMLEDTGATFVLTGAELGFDCPLRQVMLEGGEWRQYPETEVSSSCTFEDPAYVIYTSGSTGRPKGVMNAHLGVVNRLHWAGTYYGLGTGDVILQKTTFCFDVSVWELLLPLLYGSRLVFARPGGQRDNDYLKELIGREGITMLHFVPGMLEVFLPDVQAGDCQSLRQVICSGEALKSEQVALFSQKLSHAGLYNLYGPTEAAIDVTCWPVPLSPLPERVLIGKAVSNVTLQVLDKHQGVQPVGVSGELHIGGVQVALGYLHNAALTQERFIPNPFDPQDRLYRTGDLVRWQPDGTLEYLGRMDDQVKIRGYRIELGEIETVLQRSDQVNQCVVIARDGKLIGYVVSDSFNKAALLAYLHTQLPDYMVPSILVSLDQIPMTTNGKVNRKALPQALTLLESDDEQPGTETEELLCGIWQELLGLEKIGINDNFFEIGGDSIVSIQVVSRARKQGLQLQPRDIFRCQTIRALAGLLSGTTDIQGEQGELSGTAGLLPIQRWFFSQGHQSVSHYNQSLLLGVRKLIEKEQLQDIINVLLGQHDALHFRYEQKEGQWEQRYEQATIELEEAFLNNEDLPSVCSKYQAQLSITSGPLFRAVLLRNPASSEENLLLLVAHHLCVDGVSWRIIAADLQHCLENLAQNKALSLGVKGSSYRQWQERLQRYANSSFLHKQISYWSSVLSSAERLPADYELEGPRYISSMNRKESLISASLTDLLLHEVHAAYHTEVKDLLLAALALTLGDWTGSVRHLIGLEGHGREDLGSDIDLSHTVGWFTTLYPVLLEMESSGAGDYGQLICGIKERLREVPDHGLGYGALRYLHEDEAVRQQMSGTSEPDLVFNYLGHLGNLVNNSAWLSQPADMILSAGDLSAADNSYPFRLGIDSYIYEDQFRLIWSYNREEYASATIEALASAYLQHLENLISHCMARRNQSRYTPSDYGLSGKMSLKVLASHNESSGPAAQGELYGMSSLQEGMLFHGLYDNNSGTYIEQFSCELENVNPKLLKSAWAQVIAGYSILRSSFCDEGFNALIQRAHRNVELPFGEQDFRELSGTALEAAIDAFLKADRLQGFNFHIAPLMRVQLLHLSEQRSRMVWTFHHILLDGWSVPLVISRLQSAYGQLLSGKVQALLPVDNYGDFIQYLELRNRFAEQEYWQGYLSGFDTPSLLPFVGNGARRNQGTGAIGTEVLTLDATFTEQIQQYGQQQHVTVNTIMQGVWSYLLSRYTGQEDVLFGVTVSGRPTDLEHADHRVGLYIHTIPQRSILAESGTFAAWLLALQQGHTSSREYPYIPLTVVQDLLGIKGDLFDSLLVFENYPVYASATAEGLSLSAIQLAEHTNYLLSIIVEPGSSLRLSFSYNSELLAAEKVAMIAAHFKYVLEQTVADPGLLLHAIALADAAELARIQSFQGNTVPFPQQTLSSLFAASAALHADHTAVVYEGAALSYAELDALSNRLGHYLQAQGVSAGVLVPICADRSLEMIIAILGILKAGGAYVPIDPLYPQDRILFMLEDTGATFVLTGAELGFDCPLRQVMLEGGEWRQYPETEVSSSCTFEDPAYVIYTSGSTGRPKGVMNAHLGVVNRLHWAGTYYGLGTGDVILQKTTFCFDVSVWELLLPLLYGSRLVFARPGGQRDNDYLKELIGREGITMLHFVPGMLEVFLPDVQAGDCQSLRQVICSGEALKSEQVALFSQKLSHAGLYNLYGPTEAAIDVTCWPVPLSPLPERVLIGKAVSNVTLQVLDKHQGVQPVGVSGELHIGGVQVALGYLHNAALTQERFIPNPFDPQDRLYRTGDLVRWQPDGTLEYLGRMDDQVKIRGYRIELGEIETVLQRSDQVNQCVVIARDGKLIGYVVSDSFNKAALLAYLHTQLPDYMVPSILVSLDQIPMTTNGKVNRKALPQALTLLESDDEQPGTETEELLCGIWQELLGLEKIGINDNFFEIGGDSIQLIRLFQVLNHHFLKTVNVSDLFKYNSIKLQAGLMQGKTKPETHQIEV
jgi:amino acid adenylation domain-containing protein/non-ribosomal peptide synthase protein (TIGR01720 family)